MIYIQELRKKRSVYIVERNPDDPKIWIGTILGVIKVKDVHYLRVKTDSEIIRVQISGAVLPDELLNNSIFFNFDDANLELSTYKTYLRIHNQSSRRKMMGL